MKEKYKPNRERVFEIYGDRTIIPEPWPIIKEEERKQYSMHHLCFKSDKREWLDGKHINNKANLCPLKHKEHRRLHQLVQISTGHKK